MWSRGVYADCPADKSIPMEKSKLLFCNVSSFTKAVDFVSERSFSGLVRSEYNYSVVLLGEDGEFHLLMEFDNVRITREPRSIMPGDYGRRLTSKQLDDLASFRILVQHTRVCRQKVRLRNIPNDGPGDMLIPERGILRRLSQPQQEMEGL